MDYAGGPAGLTRDNAPAVCYVCGWTGTAGDILLHDCTPPDDHEYSAAECKRIEIIPLAPKTTKRFGRL